MTGFQAAQARQERRRTTAGVEREVGPVKRSSALHGLLRCGQRDPMQGNYNNGPGLLPLPLPRRVRPQRFTPPPADRPRTPPPRTPRDGSRAVPSECERRLDPTAIGAGTEPALVVEWINQASADRDAAHRRIAAAQAAAHAKTARPSPGSRWPRSSRTSAT